LDSYNQYQEILMQHSLNRKFKRKLLIQYIKVTVSSLHNLTKVQWTKLTKIVHAWQII